MKVDTFPFCSFRDIDVGILRIAVCSQLLAISGDLKNLRSQLQLYFPLPLQRIISIVCVRFFIVFFLFFCLLSQTSVELFPRLRKVLHKVSREGEGNAHYPLPLTNLGEIAALCYARLGYIRSSFPHLKIHICHQ